MERDQDEADKCLSPKYGHGGEGAVAARDNRRETLVHHRQSHRHAARESVGKHCFRRGAVCRGRERRTADLYRGDKASAGAGGEAREAGEGSAGRVSGMVVGDDRDGHLSRIAQVGTALRPRRGQG